MTVKNKKIEYKSRDGIKISAILNIPDSPPKDCIVLCHGITVDKDENGKFVTLSERLCNAGFEVLRFDFRGHGGSSLKSENMTIMGELLDIEASISYITKEFPKIGVLACSFGAGPAILYIVNHPNLIKTLVLWNPVLDYEQTFLKPRLPWGKSIFNAESYQELKNKGFVTIPGKDFQIGKQLVQEFSKYKPFIELRKVQCPVLTIHGLNDTKVPYWVSEVYGKPNDKSQFISINSDHGFGEQKDYVNRKTVDWFKKIMSSNIEGK